MAIDSVQKRMSAINPGCPWRGPMVDATEVGFNQGNRQAANFLYSGINAAAPAGGIVGRVFISWVIQTNRRRQL